ncbi:hypothetical protein ACQ4WX_41750 [Streptomyces lasalocidi]
MPTKITAIYENPKSPEEFEAKPSRADRAGEEAPRRPEGREREGLAEGGRQRDSRPTASSTSTSPTTPRPAGP